MKKEIEVYSLAEAPAFWALMHNFLGWAPRCTLGIILRHRKGRDPEEEHREILRKVAAAGGELHIYHLFTPFMKHELDVYNRRFYDNGIRLIRLILRTDGLKVIWDIGEEDRSFLRSYSPPLYDRIFINNTKERRHEQEDYQ